MKNLFPVLLPAALLLAACSGGGSQPPPVDAELWAKIQCADLNGMRFNIKYYLDNKVEGDDVIWIQSDTLHSERWESEGFRTTVTACATVGDGSLTTKANMTNSVNDYRQWRYTIARGHVDGMVTAGEAGGSSTTLTFAGDQVR